MNVLITPVGVAFGKLAKHLFLEEYLMELSLNLLQ